jgi:hypothetical protein
MIVQVNIKRTEDWIKCELYRLLVNDGFDVYPEIEVNTPIKYTRKRGKHIGKQFNRKLRVDLAVYNNGTFLCFIEVKDRMRNIPNGRQLKKYESTELHFIYCLNENEIYETVDYIKNLAFTDILYNY